MSQEQSATCKVGRKNIVLAIPIDLAVFVFENHPEYSMPGYKVKDKRWFAHYVARQILEMEDPESGDPLWGQVLDRIFAEAVENAEDFITSPEDE